MDATHHEFCYKNTLNGKIIGPYNNDSHKCKEYSKDKRIYFQPEHHYSQKQTTSGCRFIPPSAPTAPPEQSTLLDKFKQNFLTNVQILKKLLKNCGTFQISRPDEYILFVLVSLGIQNKMTLNRKKLMQNLLSAHMR